MKVMDLGRSRASRAIRLPSRRTIAITVGVAGALLAAKLMLGSLAVGPDISTPFPVVLLGTIVGLTYGLLAVGLVLIYRTNRIVNFAHGQIGAFGASVFGLFVLKYGVPYWVMFPIAMAASAGVGAIAETGVVRRLREAPRLVSVVATLGVGQFLLLFAVALNSTASAGSEYPEPAFLPKFAVGALVVTPAYSAMLLLAPVAVLAIGAFLRYSPFGLALRASAANPEAARMSGIFASRMSSLAWAIAGALSAFSAILTQPTRGFIAPEAFGPSLLLRALTCAVLARMQSLPAALVAGVGLGVLEQLMTWNYPRSGLVEITLFVVILLGLLVQRRRVGRDEEKGSWAAVQALRPVPEALRRIWLVRHLGTVCAAVLLGLAALLPLVLSNSSSTTLTSIIAFSIVGLSVGILAGLGGQLSLGQFAVAGIGTVVSLHISSRVANYPLALLYAGLAGAIVAVVIGLPALRVRGLMLTVTTLGFALVGPAWLLSQSWMLGDGRNPGRPRLFDTPLDAGRTYFYFAFGVFVVCLLLARNVWRSGFGRLLVAVRDNEDNARAFTVPAGMVKVQGYLVAGFLAGVGGAVYGHGLSSVEASAFPARISVDIVVMTVLGGVSIMAGPVIGAIYVLGIPAFLPLDAAGLAATQFGGLLLILFVPSGFAGLIGRFRDRLVQRIGRWHGVDVDAAYAGPDEAAGAASATTTVDAPALFRLAQLSGAALNGHRPLGAGVVLLRAQHLRKQFGGVVAVDDVSFDVLAGETLGLIGPNGAGKTTTFELLGGFTPPDRGTVVFDQHDIGALGPEARARLGLIRSFQDAALFPTMTVTDAVKLAFERTAPTPFLRSVLGLNVGEQAKERDARELLGFMGLDRYRDKQIQELSTGTRRIVEIACMVALRPTLLLLDEPSSGIAQRETEALGHLLRELKAQLGLTLVIIEHDIPLIMSISDRIVAMADGQVICAGSPEAVKNDPTVQEAYLGGSITAIERSGAAAPAVVPGRKRARTR